ncbi:hypothetical protein P167DRAFT_536672 [Morchella conica CCBAS932]|uniref:Uncharacterized protein n=1 Tax=Morchella conica CCBAS932 TaxID=1392247 RepID=A0A3N4KLS1_9PEZI|nr:hypothetical protein P167DRAFT_536672 [Morchella conica CCBAS932]
MSVRYVSTASTIVQQLASVCCLLLFMAPALHQAATFYCVLLCLRELPDDLRQKGLAEKAMKKEGGKRNMNST